MANPKKEEILAWAKRHGWLEVGVNGLNHAFLTPTNGQFVIIIFQMNGEFDKVAVPMAMAQQVGPMPNMKIPHL